jgi:small subunit ribosomal protein S6
MAKLSEKYESMVVFSLKNGAEQVESLKAKFSALIEENAELVGANEWGKKQLAYPINYETEGYYVLYKFDCKPDFPRELERVFNITEGILRFLTVLRNDAPARPAAETAEREEAPDKADSTEADGEDYEVVTDKVDDAPQTEVNEVTEVNAKVVKAVEIEEAAALEAAEDNADINETADDGE